MNTKDFIHTYLNKRLLAILLLGFSSGLPIALCGATLQAWFTKAGISIVAIGFLGWVGQPYVFKFLWAPLMDRYIPPLLGRRRGWMLVCQLGLIITIGLMALFNPQKHEIAMAITALLIAFISASQDISINAYTTDILKPEERGLGAAMTVWGYRVAMLVSGGLALIIAQFFGWQVTYLSMSGFMLIGVFASWFSPEPENDTSTPTTLIKAVVEPFREYLKRDYAIALLALIVLYKLGDAFALSLNTTFLLRGVGFSLLDVGAINKSVSLITSLLGVFVGGLFIARYGLYRSLMISGILQALSNLAFMFLAIVGKNLIFMAFAVGLEHFCGGMGTAAFLALLMSLCDQHYTATQFALFSALASLGRVYVGPVAGVMVEQIGWVQFFFWTAIICIPGLILLRILKRPVLNYSFSSAST